MGMNVEKHMLGLIVNPIAGLGGRAGLKGSDGPGLAEKAFNLGGSAEAFQRTKQALSYITDRKNDLIFYTYGGTMGEMVLKEMGFTTRIVGYPANHESSAKDTNTAAKLLREAGIELLLFTGGDGTARDICEAIHSTVPVIGIPAGVKMHSAVYAINPRNAGLATREFLTRNCDLREAEVMDIDERLLHEGYVNIKLYGYMMIPQLERRLQKTKTSGYTEQNAMSGMAAYIRDKMEEDTIYLVGPGSTTRAVMDELRLPNTLLGVDAVINKQLLVADANEHQIWGLISDCAQKAKIIITIIGGQGSLLGRGNQQFSPRIIRKIGRENIVVMASANKLLALKGQALLVDTGDAKLDEDLCGYIEVVTAYSQSSYIRVSN